MESLAELTNVPTTFTFEGREYVMREPTILEAGEYQRFLEADARAAAFRAVELPQADRDTLLRGVIRDIAANVYKFGGEVCVSSLRTVDGIANLLAIINRERGMTFEIAKRYADNRLAEIVAVMGVKQAESALESTDPKERARVSEMIDNLANLRLAPTFWLGLLKDSPIRPMADRLTSSHSAK